MKRFTIVATAIALMAGSSFASAEETKSGLQAGDLIGAFYVTKLAGAEDDGVKVGASSIRWSQRRIPGLTRISLQIHVLNLPWPSTAMWLRAVVGLANEVRATWRLAGP